MIVPFWSGNLSDTTHVRSHTKFQLVWAINAAFSRGGHNVPPPLTNRVKYLDLRGLAKKQKYLNGKIRLHRDDKQGIRAIMKGTKTKQIVFSCG